MKAIDLSGEWKVILDENGEYDKWHEEKWETEQKVINLPDSVNHAGLTPFNDDVDTGYLTDTHKFEGCVWYSKTFCISEDYQEKKVFLYLERTRISTVYLDGEKLETLDSLCTPHIHDLKDRLCRGNHRIDIAIDNKNYPTRGGHMTSPDTQTNWNGILGIIEIRAYEEAYITDMQVYSQKDKQTGLVCVKAKTKGMQPYELQISGSDGEVLASQSGEADMYGNIEASVKVSGENIFWDEYNTNLLEAVLTLKSGEQQKVSFGIRNLKAESLKLSVNGNEVYLRGKHDGMIFPETGYAPMDVAGWKKVLGIAKEYGMNHYRFHTCCPPDAAFTAADELGIYMEPELPFWGTINDDDAPECNKAEQDYLIKEGFRILDTFGNHPSFIMLSMGNELWGSHEKIGQMLGDYKKHDGRHLYTGGSNNFQFVPVIQENEDVLVGVRFSRDRLYRGSYAMCDAPLGFVQTDAPSSDKDFDALIVPSVVSSAVSSDGYIEIQYGTGVKKVKAGESNEIMKPVTPVISHEVGQYYFYPDFNSPSKYKSQMKPTYLKAYQENLEKNGLFEKNRAFYNSTGKLAVNCYKAELEALISSEKLSGFQILDLQDFMGQDIALVGILDAFMENKGFITRKRWNEICSDSQVFARLPRFVYEDTETVTADIRLSICRFNEFKGKCVIYAVTDDNGEIVKMGTVPVPKLKSRITDIGQLTLELKPARKCRKLHITLKVEYDEADLDNTNNTDEQQSITNHYDLWVYPKKDVEISEEKIVADGSEVLICDTYEGAVKCINDGKMAICIPKPEEDSIEGIYCTDFWNYSMFSKISRSMNRREPQGTLGLCIDTNNSLMKGFGADDYSTPQWYNLVMHSHSRNISEETGEIQQIAEPIDNPVRAWKLGFLYKKDGVLVCTSRIWEIAECPEVKYLAAEIVKYLNA